MFTGRVDEVGVIELAVDEKIRIRAPRALTDLEVGGSLCVDGVSLTVAEKLRDRFSVVVLPVTCEKTTLGRVSPGTRVNLETDLISRLVDGRPTTAAEAVSAAVANLPWAGQVSGHAGVEMAVRHFTEGGGVVIWDADSEVEGDVVFAGSTLRPQAFTFLLTRVCGHSTVPCAPEVLDRLEIGPIPGEGDRQGTAMHVPVDLAASRVPVCPPANGRPPYEGLPIRPPGRRTFSGPGTCSRPSGCVVR